MQQEMEQAQCSEWALLLATVLLNVSQIASILKEQFHLWRPYTALLSKQQW